MKFNFKKINTILVTGYTLMGVIDRSMISLGLMVVGFMGINLILIVTQFIIVE